MSSVRQFLIAMSSTNCKNLCQSCDLRPVRSSCFVNAPFKQCISPVGVWNLEIVFFTCCSSTLLKTHGALGSTTFPSGLVCAHISFMRPWSCKLSLYSLLSFLPVIVFQRTSPTFLKICIRSSKWLIRRSFQYGSWCKIESLFIPGIGELPLSCHLIFQSLAFNGLGGRRPRLPSRSAWLSGRYLTCPWYTVFWKPAEYLASSQGPHGGHAF